MEGALRENRAPGAGVEQPPSGRGVTGAWLDGAVVAVELKVHGGDCKGTV
jgi:hypothetical protein